MRIVVASDSFKGSLSSPEIAAIFSEVAAGELPGAEVVAVPMADGGEGTVQALLAATGAAMHVTQVAGPMGAPVSAAWGLLPNGSAVIEMAAASGLPLAANRCDVMAATTRGTGELIACALDAGASSVVVALGGSATNDGGMGALDALGVTFSAASGARLRGCGADLARVARIDLAHLDARIASAAVSLAVLCDVDNPLLGPCGAAAVFAPQKGASAREVAELEQGMSSYVNVCAHALGDRALRCAEAPGAGAAGGLGFALMAFANAEVRRGVESVLDLVRFDELLVGADLVVTGEGRLDTQTAHGKVVSGVAARAVAAGVPCVAVAGSVAPDIDPSALGLAAAIACAPSDLPLSEALLRARELYASAARRVLSQLPAR